MWHRTTTGREINVCDAPRMKHSKLHRVAIWSPINLHPPPPDSVGSNRTNGVERLCVPAGLAGKEIASHGHGARTTLSTDAPCSRSRTTADVIPRTDPVPRGVTPRGLACSETCAGGRYVTHTIQAGRRRNTQLRTIAGPKNGSTAAHNGNEMHAYDGKE